MCQECYVDERRCTSLLNSLVCLENILSIFVERVEEISV